MRSGRSSRRGELSFNGAESDKQQMSAKKMLDLSVVL